jgi:hypothetical protein
MKPTTAHRTAALAAWLTATDMRESGVTLADAHRTPESLRVKTGIALGDRILAAYIDNNVGWVEFVVVTEDEACTAKEIPGDRDYGDDDCVTVDGETFLVVCLG